MIEAGDSAASPPREAVSRAAFREPNPMSSQSLSARGRRVLFVASLLAAAAVAQAPSATGLLLRGGYESNVFYSGFVTPITAVTKDPAGVVTAATIDGVVRRLYDADHDGTVDTTLDFWPGTGLFSVTDVLWAPNGTSLYVCHLATLTRIDDVNADGVGDVATNLVVNIPIGFHQNNGLLWDGPGHLLLTNGSATDYGPEPSPQSATILRVDVLTGAYTVWATGVRNCYRLARHPVNGYVFGGENEWNAHPTKSLVGDEFNIYVPNLDYGYPNYFGVPPSGVVGVPPVVQLPPRLAPTGLRFNPNVRISGYENEAYMTLFSTGVGRVARIPVWFGPASGLPAGTFEEFAAGLTNPIDVEFTVDGDMLVADFSTSTIHRIYPKGGFTVTIGGAPCVGSTVTVRGSSPAHPGALCFLAASELPLPSFALAPGLDVFLDASSWLFMFSLTPGNGVFNFPVPSILNAFGETTASIAIPNQPNLAGFKIYVAGVAFDAVTGAPLAASPEQSLLVIPFF